jgi:fibronectin-binding autotransporter adhesin
MIHANYRNWARKLFQRPASRALRRACAAGGLQVECLENRLTPSGAPPTVTAIPRQTVNEDAAAITLNLGNHFTDPENDALTFTVVQTNSAGLLTPTLSGPNLTLAFAPNQFGYSYVRVTANDGTGSSTVAFEVLVRAVDDLLDDAAATTKSAPIDINVFANDGAGDQLRLVEAMNVDVVHNDPDNNATSVTITTPQKTPNISIRSGNRGDYDLRVGTDATNDVAGGMFVTQVRENTRDNSVASPLDGPQVMTSALSSDANGAWIPVFNAGDGQEYNVNAGASYFPYQNGWIGGWVVNAAGTDGGANDSLRTVTPNSGLTIGTAATFNVQDQGSGQTRIRIPGVNSQTDGILLARGGDNESNYALGIPNADGSFQMVVRDNGSNGTSTTGGNEQDYGAFVYIPSGVSNVVSGRILGSGTIQQASGQAIVTKTGTGAYELTIPGQSPTSGLLLLSSEGGAATNVDNIVTYQPDGDKFVINCWDIVNNTDMPVLEDVGATTRMASFAFIPFVNGPTLRLTSIQNSTNVANTSNMGASVTINPDGTLKYDPTTSTAIQALPPNSIAVDSFTYTTTTLAGQTSTATVTVTIVDGNGVNLSGGRLSITSASGIASTMSISFNGTNYTITDPAATFALTPAAAAAFSGSGTNTITGPSSALSSLAITLGDGVDTITINGLDDPFTINGGGQAGDTAAVNGAATFTGNASITEVTNITATAAGKISTPAGAVTLNAGNAIGGASLPVRTQAAIVVATAGAGGIVLTEDDGAAVTATATDSDVNVTSNSGTLNVTATTTGPGVLRLTNLDGTLDIAGVTSTADGNITLTSGDAITLSANVTSTNGTITIAANTDGAGSEGYDQKSARINTGSAASDALTITVNAAAGGTGNAILGPGTIGSSAGGDVAVNARGGSILWSSTYTVPDVSGTNTDTLRAVNYSFTTSGANSAVGAVAAPLQTDNFIDYGTGNLVAGSGGAYLTDWGDFDLIITNATAQGAGNIQLFAANASGHQLSVLNANTGSGSITLLADDELIIGTLTGAATELPGFIGSATFSGTISLRSNRDGGNEQRIIMRPGSIVQTTNATANAVLMRTSNSDNDVTNATFGGITLTSVKVGNGGTITVDTSPIIAPATAAAGVGNIIQHDATTVGLDAGPNGAVVLNVASGLNGPDPATSAGIGDATSPVRVRAGSILITSVNSPVRVAAVGASSITATITAQGAATVAGATLDLSTEAGILTIGGATHTDGGPVNLTGAGGVIVNGVLGDANSGDVTVTANAGDVVVNANLTVNSGRTVTLAEGNSTALGPVTVVNGTLTAANGVALSSGDLLQGTGVINGAVTVASGSTIGAGPGSGILATGNATVNGALSAELNGDAVGTGYDQINVSGTLNLTGATLNVVLGYLPTLGTKYTIVNNDAADAVVGTFANTFPLSISRGVFTVAYNGGDGNDVELTAANLRPMATFADVVPNPRSSGLPTATITFSEPVSGFDVADLSLTRNGSAVALTGVTIGGSGASYTVDGLAALTNADGDYVLTLTAAGSGIQDLGAPVGSLFGNASVAWVRSNNAAPVLDNAGAMALTDTLEDATTNSGTLISALIASAGGDRITDANGDPEGIAVTALDGTNGTWQFTTNNGANWLPLGPVAADSARLLAADANTRVRLVPSADFAGKVASALTFRAWDQTTGTAGDLANTTSNGGSTSFSAATETASLYVINLPDVRTITFQDGLDNGGATPYAGTSDTQLSQAAPDDTTLGTTDPSAGLNVDFSGGSDGALVLLRYDAMFGNGPGQIPLGSLIVSAVLTLTTVNEGHGGSFNRMLTTWDESVDTWNTFGDGATGHNTTVGVQSDDVEARSAFESFAGPSAARDQLTGTGRHDFGVTVDLQAWSSGQANHGWAIQPWNAGTDGWRFRSSEAAALLDRPKLTVKYLPAGTASIAELRQGLGGYSGTVDTELRYDQADANRDLAGESFIDFNNATTSTQALLRFNNLVGTTPLSIPAGATIAASTLSLASTAGSSPGDGGTFNRMLVDWNGADTWNKFGSATAGRNALPGIQADNIEAATTFNFQGGNTTLSPDVQGGINVFNATTDVQAWLNGTANYGWAGLPWNNGTGGWGIDQSERATESFRPKLATYYVQPEREFALLDITAGALSFVGGGGADALGIANNLTVSLAAGNYAFADPNGAIVLTPAAIAAGWSGSGTNTVTGPSSSVSSIAIATGSKTDTITISGADDPISANAGFSIGDTIVVAGSITATGDVSLFGADAITQSAGTISATGTVYLGNITGSAAPGTGAVNVTGTAILGGASIRTGALTAATGATIAPGAGPGKLDTGNLALNSGATLKLDINGATAVTGYDQVNVTGTVNLNANTGAGATLNLAVGLAPVTGTVFVLINNDGADAVAGTFAGLAQGATVSAAGQSFTISYTGGTGNDVTLTSTTVNVATTTTLVANPLATTGGSSVMFTATIAPTPGGVGTVTFVDNGTPIPGGSNVAVVGNQAVFSTTTLSPGSHPITAIYSGATGFAGSTSNLQTVAITGGAPAPAISSITVNGSTAPAGFQGAQRSRVVGITVVFNQAVLLDAGAMALALHTNSVVYNNIAMPTGMGAIPASVNVASTDNITWSVTWSGAGTELGVGSGGVGDTQSSLTDGVYDLNITASKVHPLGTPGVSMANNSTTTFHRLFGDLDSPAAAPDGSVSTVVNTGDNIEFRTAFNRPAPDYKAYLDFDGSGIINTGDNIAFRDRFNLTLAWKV